MKTAPGKQPASTREKLLEELQKALSLFASGSLRGAAAKLLNTLGYRSERTIDVGSVEEFLDTVDAEEN